MKVSLVMEKDRERIPSLTVPPQQPSPPTRVSEGKGESGQRGRRFIFHNDQVASFIGNKNLRHYFIELKYQHRSLSQEEHRRQLQAAEGQASTEQGTGMGRETGPTAKMQDR